MRSALPATLIGIVGLTLTVAGQAPDRSQPPRPGPLRSLRLPPIQKRALSNGLPLWIVELHDTPVVQVSLLVLSGAQSDPPGKFGLASLTSSLLDEGAGTRSSLEIADAIDFLGASLSAGSSFDSSVVGLHVPVARLAEALPIMADVALRPTFPVQDLERIRKERLTSLLQARDDPASIVSAAFPRLVFGPAHRYGTSTAGTPATITALTEADLRTFHARWYRPDNAALIAVGDTSPDTAQALMESAFGTWKADAPKPDAPVLPTPAPLRNRRVFLIDKPGAAQSQIRIGGPGVARSTPDYFPLVVLNTILGGSFSSRLNLNLREQHGYAYGAGSRFDMRRAVGPFFAAAGVQTDKTSDSLREFFNELTRIRLPIPAEEAARGKNYVALGFPGEFETTGDLSNKIAELIVYGLSDDHFSTYIDRADAVTEADLQRVAAKYIQPDKFTVVVVGDRSIVEAPIKTLNLGPMTVLTVDDVMGSAQP